MSKYTKLNIIDDIILYRFTKFSPQFGNKTVIKTDDFLELIWWLIKPT